MFFYTNGKPNLYPSTDKICLILGIDDDGTKTLRVMGKNPGIIKKGEEYFLTLEKISPDQAFPFQSLIPITNIHKAVYQDTISGVKNSGS